MTKSIFIKVTAIFLVLVIISQLFLYVEAKVKKEDAKKEKPKYNVSEIIVKYKNNSKEAKDGTKLKAKNNSKREIKSNKTLKTEKHEIIDVKSVDDMDSVIQALAKDDNVEYAVPNYKVTSYNYSDEQYFSNQWALKNNGQIVNEKSGTQNTTTQNTTANSGTQLNDSVNTYAQIPSTTSNTTTNGTTSSPASSNSKTTTQNATLNNTSQTALSSPRLVSAQPLVATLSAAVITSNEINLLWGMCILKLEVGI